MRPPSRTRELVRGLAALAALVVLLAGLPAGLALVAGPPIPHTLPDWAQITATLMRPDTGNTLFLAVVKVIGWAAWVLFALITLTEAAGYLRGRPARRLPGPLRPFQHLARDLVAMTALIISSGGPLTGTATAPLTHQSITATDHAAAGTASTATTAAAVEEIASAGPEHPVRPAAARTRPTGPREWRTMVIKPGDTLWAIARHTYGSGRQYPRIFNASTHLKQPHGLPRLTDPDRVFPGQHIKIPPAGDQTAHRARRHHHAAHAPTPPTPTPPTPSNTASAPAAPSPPGRTPSTPEPTTPAEAAHTPPSSPAPAPPSPASRPPAVTHPHTGTAPRARSAGATPRPAPSQDTPPAQHGADDRHHDAPATVDLPSGARIGLGLAAAISVALAATRLHRRRRHTPADQWPGPAATDPGPPTPAPVAHARKAHLDTYTMRGEPVPSDAGLVSGDITTPAPTHLTIGTRDEHNLTVELAGLDLAFTGPGALDAARAIVTELLARSHRYRAEVIIPAPDAAALLAGTGIDPTDPATCLPGLTITSSLDSAITHLEAEFIHRARLMETLDASDVPALRSADPGEPLPALILVTSAPTTRGDGLHAIMRLGRRYCVGALLLGDGHPTATLTLAANGTVTNTQGAEAGNWSGARLFHLTAADTGAMLRTIQTAAGTPEPPPPTTPAQAAPTPAETANDATSGLVRPPRADPAGPAVADTPHRPATPTTQADPPPVRLRLLGGVRIEAAGTPITTGLRRIARDLLAYLALHPDGITRDQGIDALMPDRDLDTGTTMIHTAINNARKTLRHATGRTEPMFIIHTAGRYQLDPALIDVDLWQLHTALHQAQHATTDTARIHALQQVPHLYTGELATDLTHEWAETERERLRRQATDALAHLARLLTDTHPEQALAALEHAITHDPYAEPLYQQIMNLQARLGRPDAVRRTYQLLTHRLADLDAEPTDETHHLHLRLLRPHTATPHSSPPPHSTVPGRPNRPQPTAQSDRPRRPAAPPRR